MILLPSIVLFMLELISEVLGEIHSPVRLGGSNGVARLVVTEPPGTIVG
jgi:hypothetical protein